MLENNVRIIKHKMSLLMISYMPNKGSFYGSVALKAEAGFVALVSFK
jgi:hypothetical protein